MFTKHELKMARKKGERAQRDLRVGSRHEAAKPQRTIMRDVSPEEHVQNVELDAYRAMNPEQKAAYASNLHAGKHEAAAALLGAGILARRMR